MEVNFMVAGIPAGQGSLRQNGYGKLYETTKNHRPWRDALIYAAREATPGEPFTGPVFVEATFVFPRPAGHYGTGSNAGKLKASAPIAHAKAPDLDHLQRTVGDALQNAGVVRNDGQIARWTAVKGYGEQPGVVVRVRQISPAGVEL
jgi:crossover junction endodeoxyribonuclease RusA